jgi:5'(3')-deoxyribonucleotidase
MNSKIAIDVDEVLVHLLKPMAKRRGVKLPENKKYKYLYREVFNCTEEESQVILRDFYMSEDFRNLKPIEGSQLAMNNLNMIFDKMYIVTGRQEIVREPTEIWIEHFFPGVFDDVILTNSFTPHEVKKSDICRALNIGLIIDDNKGICDQCIEAGTDALNFVGDEIYPWCEESEISIKGWNIQDV